MFMDNMNKLLVLAAILIAVPSLALADAAVTTFFTASGTSTYTSTITTSSGTLTQTIDNTGSLKIGTITLSNPSVTTTFTGLKAVGVGTYDVTGTGYTTVFNTIPSSWPTAAFGFAKYKLP
jgi:hypothetical protein